MVKCVLSSKETEGNATQPTKMKEATLRRPYTTIIIIEEKIMFKGACCSYYYAGLSVQLDPLALFVCPSGENSLKMSFVLGSRM